MYTVIIIDDSKFFRNYLTNIISGFEEFEVVAVAEDAYDAREKIKQYKPDLVTIDINMPKMDGITFLKNLMRLHPMPAFIVSSEASRHKDAYEDGALGFVEKSQPDETPEQFIKRLHLMLLSFTYLFDRYRGQKSATLEDASLKEISPDTLLASKPANKSYHRVIGIAASTGGIEALSYIVSKLPAQMPPIFIVQHIPHGFHRSFISRLNSLTELNVKEVCEKEPIQKNTIYLAGDDGHLCCFESEQPHQYGYVGILKGPRISRHRPSANIMFRSLNNCFGRGTLGVILTGMGNDGVIGLKELHDNGAFTMAQDEESCVVFGMPKQAIQSGAVTEIGSLNAILKKVSLFS